MGLWRGASRIGSHAARRLVQAGYEVVVYDNLSRRRREAVPAGIPFMAGVRQTTGCPTRYQNEHRTRSFCIFTLVFLHRLLLFSCPQFYPRDWFFAGFLTELKEKPPGPGRYRPKD
ncbi:hypothetical protein [Gelria sp. Kuro-4]|uniref:hypothetical protein n=1 Tax=Gelria sp. Kuro-4 TaxID=2796927 RepID=UPI001BF1468F|nr:hypothetical protein [Gelria sp. Kuro-4]BCV24250.1 hypothetical protein kuro4_10230 [Gelria sp. Kuro-4]